MFLDRSCQCGICWSLFFLRTLFCVFQNLLGQGEPSSVVDNIGFMDDDEDNITSILGREARKFGIAMILASQSTEHYPADVIKNCATKVVLGIDESDWRFVIRDFNLAKEQLSWIKPKESMLVQIKQSGGSYIGHEPRV